MCMCTKIHSGKIQVPLGTILKQCWQLYGFFDNPLPHVGNFLVQFIHNFEQFLVVNFATDEGYLEASQYIF